jgi:MFS superfamily sulfate permease-like transporter
MLARASGVSWLVVDAEAITNVDYSAARMLLDLSQYLKQIEVEFSFARTASSLRADLVRHHVVEAIGEQRIFPRLHNATAAFKMSQRS